MQRLLFLLWILAAGCQPKIDVNKSVILVPIGNVPEATVDSVRQYLTTAYNIVPQINTPVALPKKRIY